MAKKTTTKAKSLISCGCMDDGDWKFDDALRTLERAEEIKRDPAMMAGVQKRAKIKAESLQAITSQRKKTKAKRAAKKSAIREMYQG